MAWSLKARLSRTAGEAAGGTLALALLVGGAVFTALAGPTLSLHTQTQALHQTLSALPAATKTVQVTASWSDFTNPVSSPTPPQNLTAAEFSASVRELGTGLKDLSLPLTSGSWGSLTTNLLVASGVGRRAYADKPPELEVTYRNTLPGHARVLAGSYGDGAAPTGTLAVAVTTQVAYRFELRPGSRVTLSTVDGPVRLYVTAVLAERDPAAAFWTQDPLAGAPLLNITPPNERSLKYWVAGVFADPGQLGPMQTTFSGPGMTLDWEYPLAVGGLSAAAAPQLYAAINGAIAARPTLTGALAPSLNTVTVASPLIPALQQFLSTQAAIQSVLVMLFASLIALAAVVIVLAARMIVAKRDAELVLLRARGASVVRVAAVLGRSAAIVSVPAAAAGALLAVALTPGGAPPALGWVLAAVALATALGAAPLIAVARHRDKRAAGPGPWRRPVAEITACAGAVAALVVLHDQGASAGGQVDVYLALVPVLVTIPVVLILLRLYPLVMRLLLTWSTRGRGATGSVALAEAVRSPLTGVLPAFALALALSLTAFAGSMQAGVDRGQVNASWQATGADAVITTGNGVPAGPAAVHAIAAVRGVTHATAIWTTQWLTSSGQQVALVEVDPAGYAALVADTPFPAFPAGLLRGTGASGGTIPVLASPAAAALLGTGPAQLSPQLLMGPIRVRVAAQLGSTPAVPGGGTYVIMPMRTLPGVAGRPAPNGVLVTGTGIDDAQLSAVASQVLPGSDTAFRSTVLGSLSRAPLAHGAEVIIVFAIAAAAAFGLFIVSVGLALSAAERARVLARLTVMGYSRTSGLMLAGGLPAILTAAVAGLAGAIALPATIGSSIDISALTGTGIPIQLQLDAATLGLPAVVILLLATAALVVDGRRLRHRGVTRMLRIN